MLLFVGDSLGRLCWSKRVGARPLSVCVATANRRAGWSRCRARADSDTDREADFKAANLISLRAFGDLAFALVVYQAQLYATVYADLTAEASGNAVRPELLLLLGAVLGVWTVSETLATQLKTAARRAVEATKQATEIAKEFTTFLFSVDALLDASLPTAVRAESTNEAEAEVFLSWLGESDDDLATGSRRGARTMELLSDPARTAAPVRKQLAVRLGALRPSGNEVDSVLSRMAEQDTDPDVSATAREALERRARTLQGPTSEPAKPGAEIVEELTESSMLRTIPKEELHLICVCAGLAVSLEVYESIYGIANDPIHFIGLGWLLSVSGAAVYPNGARTFRAITTDQLSNFLRDRKPR